MTTSYLEYKSLSNLLTEVPRDDVYTELMKKEERVLDVVNRIAEQQNKKSQIDSMFYNMTLIEIVLSFVTNIRNMFQELIVVDIKAYQNPSFFVEILWTGDRKIYLGMLVVLISLFIFFIDISGK